MSELSPSGGSEGYGTCGDDVSDGVLFSGEKYPKAAGDTGAEGPFQGQTRPFPRTPFRDASCGGAIHRPPNLKVVACRFGALRAVPLLPEQRYLPKLERLCNSITFLNAARSPSAVFQSLPEQFFCGPTPDRTSGTPPGTPPLPSPRHSRSGRAAAPPECPNPPRSKAAPEG